MNGTSAGPCDFWLTPMNRPGMRVTWSRIRGWALERVKIRQMLTENSVPEIGSAT